MAKAGEVLREKNWHIKDVVNFARCLLGKLSVSDCRECNWQFTVRVKVGKAIF